MKTGTSLPAQHLAAQQTYNHLDMSVAEALRQRTLCMEGVLSCQPEESLEEVINRIVREQVPHAPHTCSQHIWSNPSHEQLQFSLCIRRLPYPPSWWKSSCCPHWPPACVALVSWATAS